MIPYGRQDVASADLESVREVLLSDFLTQGPTVPAFETAIARYCGCPHAVALNSATSALHASCIALNLGPGDRLWTSPNTFVASANCGLHCGATVDFVDIDPDTYNMSLDALAAKLESAEAAGTLPKILIPVHFAGQPCDMRSICALASRYGFRIIEDASHAIGGRYSSEAIGSCQFSDITVFSFHPVKIITTGEGGVATTRDSGIAARLRRLRSHGITRDPEQMVDVPDGPWDYQQIELGSNYRMTDIQAALGISQLARLDDYVARRRLIAARYDAALRDLPLILPHQRLDGASAWHLYPVQIDPTRAEISRRALFDGLRQAGIGVNVHYKPVHTQPYYRALGFHPGDFPGAEAYYGQAVSLPIYPTLTGSDQDLVIDSLKRLLDPRGGCVSDRW